MFEPSYTVERRCSLDTVDVIEVGGEMFVRTTPLRVLERVLCLYISAVPINPDEDWFRVIDPVGAEWFYGYRDGKLTRLLRPPVAPGSLPPSP